MATRAPPRIFMSSDLNQPIIVKHKFSKWKKIGFLSVAIFILIAIVATVLLKIDIPHKNKRKLHLWNMFHYVLGTKYFDEVGYYNLYNAILLADLEERRIFNPKWETRNQYTYEKFPIKNAIRLAKENGLRERFSDERWDSFKADMEVILRQRSIKFWKLPIADRGFNPSPAWLMVHKPFLNLVGDITKWKLLALCYIQVLFYLLTIFLVWWAFGLRSLLVFAFWFLIYIGNGTRMLGGYFSYDWFFLTIGAVALLKKGFYVTAGPLLAYAAMMRGFPGLLAAYSSLQILVAIIRWKRPQKRHILFIGSLALSCILIFLLSSAVTGGISTWIDWKGKIEIHAERQVESGARVGMLHLFANSTSKQMEPNERVERMKTNQWKFNATLLLCLPFVILAMLKRDDHNGIILGIALVFLSTLLSRYYFAIGALFVTWSVPDMSPKIKRISTYYLFSLLALIQIFSLSELLNRREYYFVFNIGISVYILFIVITFLVKDFYKPKQIIDNQPSGSMLADDKRNLK